MSPSSMANAADTNPPQPGTVTEMSVPTGPDVGFTTGSGASTAGAGATVAGGGGVSSAVAEVVKSASPVAASMPATSPASGRLMMLPSVLTGGPCTSAPWTGSDVDGTEVRIHR